MQGGSGPIPPETPLNALYGDFSRDGPKLSEVQAEVCPPGASTAGAFLLGTVGVGALLLSAGRHSSKGVARESPKETEVQAEVRCPSTTTKRVRPSAWRDLLSFRERQPPLSIRPPGFVSDGWRLEPGRGGLKRSHRLARIA